MATPTDDIAILRSYWLASSYGAGAANAYDVAATAEAANVAYQLRSAQDAMSDLVDVSSSNPYTRSSVFAAGAIFETALGSVARTPSLGGHGEAQGITDQLLSAGSVAAGPGSIALGFSDVRPPRQIMLDGIYAAGTGGLFTPKDPTGITSWLNSVNEAEIAIATMLTDDPNPSVKASLLKIIADMALPVSWVQRSVTTFGADATKGPIETAIAQLQSSLATSPYDTSTRTTLASLCSRALGAIGTAASQTAAQVAFAQVTTGDGNQIPTTQPPPKPWYKNGGLLSAIALGALGGAMAYERGVFSRFNR